MNEPWDREQTVFEDGKKAGIKEVVEWLNSNMALERCDPDVMAYFEDYYWIPKHIWQDKQRSLNLDG